MLSPMQDTPPQSPQPNAYLVRCPACRDWFEEADLIRPTEARDGRTVYRCPRDATVLEPPAQRPPPLPPMSARERVAMGCFTAPLLLFDVGWMFAALPLLAGAVLVLLLTGNAVPLIVWAVVSAVWLVLIKVVGPINN